MVSEIGFFSLSHSLHHQLGYRSNIQTYTNKKAFSILSVITSVGLSVWCLNILRLTGSGGELQAAGAELRLGDGLQENSVLSGGDLGW